MRSSSAVFACVVAGCEGLQPPDAAELRESDPLALMRRVPLLAASWFTESNVDGGWLGWAVSSAGDVNADGFDDVVIGMPVEWDSLIPGEATVYLGSATGPETSPVWTGVSQSPNTAFGYSVSSAGDVNGDGFD